MDMEAVNLMKEVVREYAKAVIAGLAALLILAVISGTNTSVSKALPQSQALSQEADSDALEGYWRSR